MRRFKGQSVIEVLLVFILMVLGLWTWATIPLPGFQRILHGKYFSHVVYVLVAVLFLLLGKRSFKSYGLSLVKRRHSLKWGLIFAAMLWLPALFCLVFGWLGAELPKHLLSALVFQIIFSGFGEEILFRGYFQSRINEEFDRPFNIDGLRFGAGLIITSLLFGFGHVLNPFNPLQGRFVLDWSWGLFASISGLFLGLVREKTGSILAPGIIHGLESGVFMDARRARSAFIIIGVGWAIRWFLLFNVFAKTEAED